MNKAKNRTIYRLRFLIGILKLYICMKTLRKRTWRINGKTTLVTSLMKGEPEGGKRKLVFTPRTSTLLCCYGNYCLCHTFVNVFQN